MVGNVVTGRLLRKKGFNKKNTLFRMRIKLIQVYRCKYNPLCYLRVLAKFPSAFQDRGFYLTFLPVRKLNGTFSHRHPNKMVAFE